MHAAVRAGLVVFGAAMACYGAASLAGGWLGTPPWWGMREPADDLLDRRERGGNLSLNEWLEAAIARGDPQRVQNVLDPPGPTVALSRHEIDDPARGERFEGEYGITRRPARRWTSAPVVAAGLALFAVGLRPWGRRRDAASARAATTSHAGAPTS